MELRLFSGGLMLGGSVAFDSSRIVCSTKKSFIKDALVIYLIGMAISIEHFICRVLTNHDN